MANVTSGYIGRDHVERNNKEERKVWQLEELCGPDSLGFQYISVEDGLVDFGFCKSGALY
jgi:hypothetical protein